jgi:hypothetical protein
MPKPPPQWVKDHDFAGQETVWIPAADVDEALIDSVARHLPPGTTFGFNYEQTRVWFHVSKPANTRQVIESAFESLERPCTMDPPA